MPRKRNPVAKALADKRYQPKVIPNKKKEQSLKGYIEDLEIAAKTNLGVVCMDPNDVLYLASKLKEIKD